ncbi:MAG: VOC family protein [Candidatus Binatia bacterium]
MDHDENGQNGPTVATAYRDMMRFDHVSIAVRDIDTALGFFRTVVPVDMRVDKRRGYTDDFNWCDFYVGQFKLELIEATRPDSFVRRFIDRRGEGMHHLSLEVTGLEPLVRRLEAGDIRVVDRFDAGGGEMTAFVSPRSAHGVLIQFWQVPRLVEPERPATAPFRLRSGGSVTMRIDHVSIAVRDISTTLEFFRHFFPIRPGREKHVGYDRSFALANFTLGGYKVELIEQADDSPSNFVRRFLARRGEGLHHISIHVDRLDPLLAQFEADGLRMVGQADLGHGRKTAFISPRSAHGVLIQFWQEPSRLV